jgi:hypothetical protein
MALSNASGPSSTPPVIWPRSAILHSAAASIVGRSLGFTVSTAESKRRGACLYHDMREVDRILDAVALDPTSGDRLIAASVTISSRG